MQAKLTSGNFHDPDALEDAYRADFTYNGHPIKELTQKNGTTLVCQRCGRWARLENVDSFENDCDPYGSHSKHYTVNRRIDAETRSTES